MALSDEHIKKYQTLYLKHFGKNISNQQAYDGCIKLVRLMELVYKPMTEKDYNRFLIASNKDEALQQNETHIH